jgi:hypothetical protein
VRGRTGAWGRLKEVPLLAVDPCYVFDTECAKKLESGWSSLASAGTVAALAGR